MNNEILEFCTKYVEKLKLDKQHIEDKKEAKEKGEMCCRPSSYIGFTIGLGEGIGIKIIRDRDLFILDQEDLKYLYDKYSKRLQKEMEDNVAEVKRNYESAKQ